ncbi:MAG: VanZ family protein [Oscillospiraceae bacterium]|nr:VanZ family protein [Oscillospiraceae bacterium]
MGYRILVFLAAIVIGLLLIRWNRKWARPLAVPWLAALVYVAFLTRTPYAVPRALLDPFHALKLFLKADNVTLLKCLRYLEGAGLNILLFVPFGYLLPLLWRRADRWWKVVLCGFVLSLGIELIQLVTHLGMFDLDDLMNNSLGAFLGWGCFCLALRREPGD